MNDSEFMRENIFREQVRKTRGTRVVRLPEYPDRNGDWKYKTENQKIRNASGGGYTLLYISNS